MYLHHVIKLNMASQPEVSVSGDFVEVSSFVRGIHAYKDLWEPSIGEVLLLQREPENSQDKLAVAVLKSGRVVGHVPMSVQTHHRL